MLKIGLTGGIGSGKTRVADYFASWGATLVDTDLIAHSLTMPQGDAIEALRHEFGTEFITDEGAMDRVKMREYVFAEPERRNRLERILHPLIRDVTNRQILQARGCYVVVVVPLLIESGQWHERVDRVCVVDCDPATQIQRVRARSGLTAQAIERIMSVQATREQRLAVADDVILNDAATSLPTLEARARQLHLLWMRLATGAS
ncbi:dephospho-CoA kinase [Paenalcaligenes niemegkensis]|uniref:dephospho-CoA kinase n=1 Tax=Paenalcaligenes niemegkensis TaxID=2895469 RepID=UPI001EE91478|nr:dephospho-CoA kinase [Paenalcaligenes niemegkensis]MCQ9615524.1 dephospho-CoA kinase [Paenalcaligenes niemegkensis]